MEVFQNTWYLGPISLETANPIENADKIRQRECTDFHSNWKALLQKLYICTIKLVDFNYQNPSVGDFFL